MTFFSDSIPATNKIDKCPHSQAPEDSISGMEGWEGMGNCLVSIPQSEVRSLLSLYPLENLQQLPDDLPDNLAQLPSASNNVSIALAPYPTSLPPIQSPWVARHCHPSKCSLKTTKDPVREVTAKPAVDCLERVTIFFFVLFYIFQIFCSEGLIGDSKRIIIF